MSELYTSSRLKVLRSCVYKHHLRYTLNIRGPETSVMRFGTLAHAALEAYFKAWQGLALTARNGEHDDRLAAALAVIDTVADKIERAKLRVLIFGYHLKWGAEPWEILAVEIQFEYELDGYRIGGKIDAIVRDLTDGSVWVLEHKSTSMDTSPGSSYWARLAVDTQVSIYIDGATMLGHEIVGCIYDVLQRPGHERKLATPEDKRKYKLGKGCKICGGNLQGKQGTMRVGDRACAVCRATGWRLDENGVPEAPALYSNQRETDETADEYEMRVADEVADAPDEFFRRVKVVRLDGEIDRLRLGLIDTIRMSEVLAAARLAPPNPDSCAAFGSMCSYFPICAGQASADDEIRFPRSAQAHPELVAVS
ncbi:MAG: PD-(D/E)XK nuclease family protein [Actinobacteria bacterium]|nr:PD-(D/E)XK nuclease family protein [Actinomycetota bacterium]